MLGPQNVHIPKTGTDRDATVPPCNQSVGPHLYGIRGQRLGGTAVGDPFLSVGDLCASSIVSVVHMYMLIFTDTKPSTACLASCDLLLPCSFFFFFFETSTLHSGLVKMGKGNVRSVEQRTSRRISRANFCFLHLPRTKKEERRRTQSHNELEIEPLSNYTRESHNSNARVRSNEKIRRSKSFICTLTESSSTSGSTHISLSFNTPEARGL